MKKKSTTKFWLIFTRFDLVQQRYVMRRLNQQEQTILQQPVFKHKNFLKNFKFLKKGTSTLQLQKQRYLEHKFLKLKKIWLKKKLKQFQIWLQHFFICISVLITFLGKIQILRSIAVKVKQHFCKRLYILIFGIKMLRKNILFVKQSYKKCQHDYKVNLIWSQLFVRQLRWYRQFTKRSWSWNLKFSFKRFFSFLFKPIFFWFIYYFNIYFFFCFLTLFSLWLRYFYRSIGPIAESLSFRLKKALFWFYTFENICFKSIKKQFYRYIHIFFSPKWVITEDYRLSPIDFWFHYIKQRTLVFFRKIWKRRYNKIGRFYNLFKFNNFVTRRVGGWKWRFKRRKFERKLKAQLLKSRFNRVIQIFYKKWRINKSIDDIIKVFLYIQD